VSIGVTLALEQVALRLLRRLGRRSAVSDRVYQRCVSPAAVLAVVIGVDLSLGAARLPHGQRVIVTHLVALALIAAVAWLATGAVLVAEDMAMNRYDIGVADNLRARKVRTQIVVMRRVTVTVVVIITGAVMLTTFAQVRALGASLLASAGIAGLAAGTAARPTLGNLVAGVQIAFTEPIRLDDVVVVQGEWGRVEEITLTYVVVRTWDQRAAILPISYFVDHPIQNWTRSASELIGSAFFHLDYQVPMAELRAAFQSILAESSHWNGRVAALQVTDTTERTVEIRAIMSAPNSAASFDLRCEVRERLIAWLQDHHPEALPRVRNDLAAESGRAGAGL
jgi:small-conductance mechanosensitive channel